MSSSAVESSLSSSCCCPTSNNRDKEALEVREYEDLKSGASVAPTIQTMKRDMGHPNKDNKDEEDNHSDVDAVDWWRTHSNQSGHSNKYNGTGPITPDRSSTTESTPQPPPMPMTPDTDERNWAKRVSPEHAYVAGASTSRMATVESIEVDELSAVQEDHQRREQQQRKQQQQQHQQQQQQRNQPSHYLPTVTTPPMRAPSLPMDWTRTEDDSLMSDESPLTFKLVEHEEEEQEDAYRRHASSQKATGSPMDFKDAMRRPTRHDPSSSSPPAANASRTEKEAEGRRRRSLHDLRHAQAPMADAVIVDDYLAAAENSIDMDADELDQIILGVKKGPLGTNTHHHQHHHHNSNLQRESSSSSSQRQDAETSRVEDLLLSTGGRKRKPSPESMHRGTVVGSMGRPPTSSSGLTMTNTATTFNSSSHPPAREPASPKYPPTAEQAAAAAMAAASQIRAPSPHRLHHVAQQSTRFGTSANTPTNKTVDNVMEESLSTVPSNVDSETRDRYLLACRLLKATMIEKDARLQPEDKDFLRELLTHAEQTRAPSADDIAAIETASDVLLSDTTEDDILFLEPQQQQNSRVSQIQAAWQKKSQELFAIRHARTPGLVLPTPPSPNVMVRTAPTPPEKNSSSTNAASTRELQPTTLASQDDRKVIPTSPFIVLGKSPHGPPGVLTQPLMEALRGFFPYAVTEENFWLRYTLEEHGGTLHSLLDRVKGCRHTVIGVETKEGNVFGAFCSSPWTVQPSWFGSGECFLWRLKKSRLAGGGSQPNYDFDNEMEVYPYTGHDEQIQYCTEKTLAVGGGEWSLANGSNDTSPHENEPMGIAFMLDGDLMGGETNSCATFANPRLCGKGSSNEFDIVGLEVWTLTPCLTVADAQRLEDKHTFVKQNARKR